MSGKRYCRVVILDGENAKGAGSVFRTVAGRLPRRGEGKAVAEIKNIKISLNDWSTFSKGQGKGREINQPRLNQGQAVRREQG